MTFKDQKWETRLGKMGDQAEAVFEDVFQGTFERTGFNRPEGIDMSKLPASVRFMPDYIRNDAWYEVQGCGRDLKLKFKPAKMMALSRLEILGHPIKFFLYCSETKEWVIATFDQTWERVLEGERCTFPEGVPYRAVAKGAFEGWISYVPSQ